MRFIPLILALGATLAWGVPMERLESNLRGGHTSGDLSDVSSDITERLDDGFSVADKPLTRADDSIAGVDSGAGGLSLLTIANANPHTNQILPNPGTIISFVDGATGTPANKATDSDAIGFITIPEIELIEFARAEKSPATLDALTNPSNPGFQIGSTEASLSNFGKPATIEECKSATLNFANDPKLTPEEQQYWAHFSQIPFTADDFRILTSNAPLKEMAGLGPKLQPDLAEAKVGDLSPPARKWLQGLSTPQQYRGPGGFDIGTLAHGLHSNLGQAVISIGSLAARDTFVHDNQANLHPIIKRQAVPVLDPITTDTLAPVDVTTTKDVTAPVIQGAVTPVTVTQRVRVPSYVYKSTYVYEYTTVIQRVTLAKTVTQGGPPGVTRSSTPTVTQSGPPTVTVTQGVTAVVTITRSFRVIETIIKRVAVPVTVATVIQKV